MKKINKIFVALVILGLIVYGFFCKKPYEILDYFLPLSNSMLRGRLDVSCQLPLNELVNVSGRCFVVYPPAPSFALLPFAILFGTKLSQVYPSIIYASLAGGIFYLALRKLASEAEAFALAILLMFGTNFFMITLIGRSWYFAHVMAVFFMALSILFALYKRPTLAGLFIALGGMSRLPMFFAFPAILYLLKPAKKDYLKFFTPLVVLGVIFLLYNWVRFGSPTETGYSLIPGVLDESWYKQGIISLSYIPRNLNAMFLAMPEQIRQFPWFIPSTNAMALWLTTPALVLLLLGLRNKLTLVMVGSFILVIFTDLMHGAVGFSQFGYRFALDGILLLIIGLIPVVKKYPLLTYAMILLSVTINFYVVIEYYLGIFQP